MDLPINRDEHPRSARELSGQNEGSAGPDPSFHDIDGPGLARSLGARFRKPSVPWPGSRSGDGIVEFPIR
jgi:hypothetical protein